jgi:DNA-binding SARP family transcriptional activator
MEFRILGPRDVRSAAGPATPAGAKPRALLAMLLLRANEPVSADRLAIALWGEGAPAGAGKTIQVHVSRLRRALGEPGVLATTPGGYRLRVLRGELDADRGIASHATGALEDHRRATGIDELAGPLSRHRGRAGLGRVLGKRERDQIAAVGG